MDDHEIKLPKSIRKIFKFFFKKLAAEGHFSKPKVPHYGYCEIEEAQIPAGLNEPFYDGAIMGGSDKPQDIKMRILHDNFFKNMDGLFPSDIDQNYCYIIVKGHGCYYSIYELSIYRSGYLQLILNKESAGAYIMGTCKFDKNKHVKKLSA